MFNRYIHLDNNNNISIDKNQNKNKNLFSRHRSVSGCKNNSHNNICLASFTYAGYIYNGNDNVTKYTFECVKISKYTFELWEYIDCRLLSSIVCAKYWQEEYIEKKMFSNDWNEHLTQLSIRWYDKALNISVLYQYVCCLAMFLIDFVFCGPH